MPRVAARLGIGAGQLIGAARAISHPISPPISHPHAQSWPARARRDSDGFHMGIANCYASAVIPFSPEDVVAARFWSRVQRCQSTQECWVWTRARDSSGYGLFSVGGRNMRAHRVAYTLDSNASIPEGLFVLHLCDNPPCCNPSHLQLGDNAENMRQMRERQRHQFRGPSTCGTHSGYTTGCRCEPCKRANAAYSRLWRRARKETGPSHLPWRHLPE